MNDKTIIEQETDYDKLNRFLLTMGNDKTIDIRRKVVLIKKFIEILSIRENKES